MKRCLKSTEHAHQVGRFMAGRIASKKEELEHLRTRVEHARLNFERSRSHANEIAKIYADQALADFLAANPRLAEVAS